ncbi:alpha/beta fold hydrolase [Eikenella glucosivorans]|uniref:alpha/beta fold hydrolase n=1 Tax=Eikenella glucosivorans TaxID=2766967 RepID=UPI0030B812EE
MHSRRTFLQTAAAAILSACSTAVSARSPRAGRADSPQYLAHERKPAMNTISHLGADLFYRTGGPAGAPALLLLHGGLGSAEDFAALMPELQRHFFTIETDTRGHGRSTRGSVPLTYAQIADDARHLADALGLRAYHLFGFSDGGTAAYRLAAADARVQSVLTVGASWHSRQLAAVREMFESLTPEFFRENMAAQVAAYEKLNPQPDLPALAAALKQLWLDTSATGYPNEAVARIQAPVLAARGEGDFLLSLNDLADLRCAPCCPKRT